jgi:DNA-binding IclR family transcriptional regulator
MDYAIRNRPRRAARPARLPRAPRAPGRSGRSPGRQGVASVETGLGLVRALAAHPGPVALKQLAAAARLAPAKAHRYLVSLGRAGLVEQEGAGGRYRLGPLALEIGLAALRGLDAVRAGAEALAALQDAVDETVLLAVWGNRGPVVVRWAESSRPVTTNVRAGFVMPLTNSSTGRVFAAFLPEAVTAPLLAAEFRRRPAARAGWQRLMAETRRRGLARVDGDLSPGAAALSAPVFDADGRCAAVLAAVGHQGTIDIAWTGPVARALAAAAADLSRRLGFAAAPAATRPRRSPS